MKKETVVVGLGNVLMADEGIGCAVVEHFSKQAGKYPNVEFTDIGTGGMALLHLIAGRKKAILIDCAKMGTRPGTLKRFTPEDVKTIKQLCQFSLHDSDVMRVIEMSRQLGQCPESIVIFGIEPGRIEPGRQLSTTLAGKLADYIAAVAEELKG
ncbi:MAG: hydrogenase maturation protease [Sedimentisphaerales bacterium]|nr:hydrogenase maturation protease [Sedimentisphaerales bacterium]